MIYICYRLYGAVACNRLLCMFDLETSRASFGQSAFLCVVFPDGLIGMAFTTRVALFAQGAIAFVFMNTCIVYMFIT